jgi:transcriptional regulator with XRE-family HTH domain
MALVREDPLATHYMSPLLPNYLRTLRMQSGLTQPELAALLGVTESALSKFETQALAPTKNLVVGIEVIFGKNAREVFPALYALTERHIMRRAATLAQTLERNGDALSKKKLQLIKEMVEMSEADNSHL